MWVTCVSYLGTVQADRDICFSDRGNRLCPQSRDTGREADPYRVTGVVAKETEAESYMRTRSRGQVDEVWSQPQMYLADILPAGTSHPETCLHDYLKLSCYTMYSV